MAGEMPVEYVTRLSQEKVRRVTPQACEAIIMGADTAVVADGDVLGKPATNADAVRMLKTLRGRTHTVVTGITALDCQSGRCVSASKSTEVTMRGYSDGELAAYVASGEPLDKAGGYAVQDEVFRPALEIQGCYLNVVGFPLCTVVELLASLGLHPRLSRGWQLPRRCLDCPLENMRGAFRR